MTSAAFCASLSPSARARLFVQAAQRLPHGGGSAPVALYFQDERPHHPIVRFHLVAGVPHHIVTYAGAPLSFFDRKYAEYADASADAWTQMLNFINTGTL